MASNWPILCCWSILGWRCLDCRIGGDLIVSRFWHHSFCGCRWFSAGDSIFCVIAPLLSSKLNEMMAAIRILLSSSLLAGYGLRMMHLSLAGSVSYLVVKDSESSSSSMTIMENAIIIFSPTVLSTLVCVTSAGSECFYEKLIQFQLG